MHDLHFWFALSGYYPIGHLEHVEFFLLKNSFLLSHLSMHTVEFSFLSDGQVRQTLVPFLAPCLHVRQLVGQD